MNITSCQKDIRLLPFLHLLSVSVQTFPKSKATVPNSALPQSTEAHPATCATVSTQPTMSKSVLTTKTFILPVTI